MRLYLKDRYQSQLSSYLKSKNSKEKQIYSYKTILKSHTDLEYLASYI